PSTNSPRQRRVERAGRGRIHSVLVFGLLFTFTFVSHAPLLRLPYFWDEAGYFIPAARDLLLNCSLIPYSTTSNAHQHPVMAHLDVAAATLTIWGLRAYLRNQPLRTTGWLSLAVLAKETAVLAPLALMLWEIGCVLLRRKPGWWSPTCLRAERADLRIGGLAVSMIPLGFWLAYHCWRTGHVFGNPEFVRYNIKATLD